MAELKANEAVAETDNAIAAFPAQTLADIHTKLTFVASEGAIISGIIGTRGGALYDVV